MTTNTFSFCPAAAAAADVARLESYLDLVLRGLNQAVAASPAVPDDLLRQMETHAATTLEAMDAARTRLSEATAHSASGALAQLLAAIRDLRVGDDDERVRAGQLEARAADFLVRTLGAPTGFAQVISRTPPSPNSPAMDRAHC
jgi:hypothetical protein